MIHTLKSVAPRYEQLEDRILLAINLGKDDEWSCWLTRRMTLGVLQRFNVFLDRTSAVTRRTSLEHRAEVAAMERDAAIESTRKAVKPIAKETIDGVASSGELAMELRLTPERKGLALEITGRAGNQARALLNRAQLRTILFLIQKEATKANWVPRGGQIQLPEPQVRIKGKMN